LYSKKAKNQEIFYVGTKPKLLTCQKCLTVLTSKTPEKQPKNRLKSTRMQVVKGQTLVKKAIK
jgi:hypothetical protein